MTALTPSFLRSFVMLVVMITCYNKLLLNCPILFKGLKTKILAKDVKCEILQIKIFLKDGPN